MTEKRKVTMIDPPSGWKYGFPKPLPDPKPDAIELWLIAEGYPLSEIESYGKHFYCRFWEEEIEVESREERVKRLTREVSEQNAEALRILRELGD